MTERTPYPKYQECPCGSGQKYKFCCYTKGFHYYLDDGGEVSKSVPLTKEAVELLKHRRMDLEKELGRPLRPDDRLFPDLDVEDMKRKGGEIMRATGIRPVLIYAYEKTGLMVTAQNKHLIADIDLEEWDAAVEEYYELHPEDDLRTT
jgi:hypothetical protein